MNFSDLKTLVEVKYLKGQSSLRRVTEREAELRRELEALTMRAREVDAEGNAAMRSVGADILWRAWISKAKADLNMQLAQALAQKETLMAAARKDYGKVMVVEELAQKQVEANQKERQSRRLNAAIEFSALKDQ